MASFFGEIRPVVSRAVDDEESDDEAITAEPNTLLVCAGFGKILLCREVRFEWKPSTNIDKSETFSPDWLVIGVGKAAAGFLMCHNEMPKNLGSIIEITDSKDNDVLSVHSNAKGNVIYCLASTFIHSDKLWKLKHKILNCTEGMKVCLLDSDTVYNYHTSMSFDSMSLPFLRYLKTSKALDTPAITTLEQPNMAKGLTSAVLSHCELNGVPAVLYICYTESVHADAATLQAFSSLMQREPFNGQQVPKDEVKERINSFLQSSTNNGNIYI